MRVIKYLSVIILPLLLNSCDLFRDTPSQKIYFEVNYTNWAWGYVSAGYYIDNNRNFYTYSYDEYPDESWNPKQWDKFSESELNEKFNHSKTLIKTVDEKVFVQMIDLIEAASAGPYSDKECPGADRGGFEYTAYKFKDTNSGRNYFPVSLDLTGDCSQTNLSDAAVELLSLIKSSQSYE